MTPQEMFDTAYLMIIQQGQKSNTPNGCKYRGPSGLKCAIGHMIPDDLAKAWDDRTNSSITQIRATPKYPIPDFLKENRKLAADIQSAHDLADDYTSSDFVRTFKRRMAQVAKDYKLTIPDLETTE